MTINEAIQHAEAVANSCSKCADEHRQLAEWLKELKCRRENEHPVKAITVDRLAEIMDKALDIEPPCYHLELKYDCGRKCRSPYFDDYKGCWKEFFEHYAEGEE